MPVYIIPRDDKGCCEREEEGEEEKPRQQQKQPSVTTKVNRMVYYEYVENKGYYCN